MNRVFRLGEDQGEKGMGRAWEAKELKATIIPLLTLLAKDHKQPKEKGDPKTRPVAGASKAINGELSEWTSEILEAALDTIGITDTISTEDMLSKIDRAVE